MKLNLIDTLVLASGIGCAAGFGYFVSKGWWSDLYFPGMMALGFFMWFLYRKGEDYKNSNK